MKKAIRIFTLGLLLVLNSEYSIADYVPGRTIVRVDCSTVDHEPAYRVTVTEIEGYSGRYPTASIYKVGEPGAASVKQFNVWLERRTSTVTYLDNATQGEDFLLQIGNPERRHPVRRQIPSQLNLKLEDETLQLTLDCIYPIRTL